MQNDFTEPEQAEFNRLKELVLSVISTAEQVTSYGMPTFTYKKKIIFHVGAFTSHMSIFPGPAAVAKFTEELKDYTTSKGTIQFTLNKPLPSELVKRIISFRVQQIDQG